MYLLKLLTILFFNLNFTESTLKIKGFNDLFFRINNEKCYVCAQSAQKFLSRIIFNGLEIFQLKEAVYPESNAFDLNCLDISNNHNFLFFPAFSGSQRLGDYKNKFEKQDLALGYLIYSEFFIGNKFQYIPCDAISFILMPFIFKFIMPKYLANHKINDINLEDIFFALNLDIPKDMNVLTKMEFILKRLVEIYTISCLTQKTMFGVINEDCNQILEKLKKNQSYIDHNKLTPLLRAFFPLKMSKDNFLKDFNVNKHNIEKTLKTFNLIDSIDHLEVLLNCLFDINNFNSKDYFKIQQDFSQPLKIQKQLNNSFLSTSSQGLSYNLETTTP